MLSPPKPLLCIVLLLATMWHIAQGQQVYGTAVNDTVEVIVDQWGVPHIFARTEGDLFFGQGFNAARDRLFQFEIWRRQATGTVAEILGRRELKRDIGARLFKFRGDMELEMLHYHPRGRMIIESFVEGINAYISWINANPERLPLPFQILKIKPKPWTPEIVVSRHQGLLGNIGQELDIGRLVHLLGEEKVKEIMWFHPFEPNLTIHESIDGEHLLNDILELYNAFRKPVKFLPADVGKYSLSEDLWSFPEPIPDRNDPSTIGSNNWVISGELTQSGYPIMANDPHRRLAIPSLRYLCHLNGPGWNVIGAGEPEIPGISIGHNEYGAWGLTVFRTDAEDLYVYRLNPENAMQYWYNNTWHAFQVIMEDIPIKGSSEPERIELKYSVHGPVVYQDSAQGIAYAVRCGWQEVGGAPYLASLRMNQSFDFESFREACTYSHIPGENMVWADRVGNIGWQAVGIAPIRNGFSGLVPIPGDGSYEWSGFLDIRKKPNSFNPASGHIITANENLTGLDFSFPEAIGYLWSDPVRGDRIAEVIESGRKFTVMDMAKLQNDHVSIPARTLLPLLEGVEIRDTLFTKYIELLLGWDGLISPSSIAATIYNEWEKELKEAFKQMEVPLNAQLYYDNVQHKVLADWLIFPSGTFEPDPINGRNRLLLDALADAVANLQEKIGPDASQWHYGQAAYKHVQINHALGTIASSFQQGQLNTPLLPRGGSASTVGNTGGDLNQTSGATFKIIVNTDDWDRSLAINAPGQSGDPSSIHYQDLFSLWANDQYFPLFFSRDKIESVAKTTFLLIPQK